MKRIALTLLAVCLACAGARAQDFLDRLKNKTKENIERKVENRIEQKVDSTVNTTVDNALDRLFNPKKKDKKPQDAPKAAEKKADQPKGGSKSGNAAVSEVVRSAKAKYAKCDFVPGDDLFFEDDFSQERLGEFPLRWELFDGYVEIASIEGRKVLAFTDNGLGQVTPNMNEKWAWLPDSFTLEYDMYLAPINEEEESTLGMEVIFGSRGQSDYYNAGSVVGFYYCENGSSNMEWSLNKPGSDMRSSGQKALGLNTGTTDYASDSPIKAGEWNHFAFSFNKRAFKGYVNGFRVINVPAMEAPGYFYFNSTSPYRFSGISNVRLCEGAVPLYDRLINDGKIVSYNITFETGKAELKQESIIELQRIAALMEQYPDLAFEVVGHTDNTGSDKVNDPLSQQRAETIVAALVELGINEARLTPVGKGSHEPLVSNKTPEGRAKNRRVEFVKK